MTTPKPLHEAVKRIAQGYLFLHLHIRLSTLDILPDWVGYGLMLEALTTLGQERRTALLLRPLGKLLLGWNLWVWVSEIFSWRTDFAALELIATVLSLYFHFQLLTDLADLALSRGYERYVTLLTLRTARTLLITLLALPFPWTEHSIPTAILAIVGLLAAFWLYVSIREFSKWLEAEPPLSEEA